MFERITLKKKQLLIGSLFILLLLVSLHPMKSFAATVSQTGAELNAVTVAWTPQTVSSGYTLKDYKVYVKRYSGSSAEQLYATLPASVQSCRIAGLAPGTKYTVQIKYEQTYNRTGRTSEYSAGSVYGAKTLPGNITGLKQKQWWYFALSLDVEWDRQDAADGYEYICRTHNGQVHKQGTAGGYSNSASFSIKNEMIYTVQVRAFETINGRTYYSDWSAPITCFTQPRVSKAKIKGGKLNVKWKKVSGATGYAICVSTKQNGPYKVVKKVSAKKSSATVKKFKGKKFKSKKKYYVYVQTLKKIGAQTFTSGELYCWSTKGSGFGYIH